MSRLPPNFLRPLPADTRARVQDCYQVTFERDRQRREDWTGIGFTKPGGEVLNPGLFLNKFCPDAATLKKREGLFYAAWKAMADGEPAEHAAALLERRAALLSGLRARTLTGEVVWRLVIGLGNPNPLETSLTLHPQYGVPLIPGSAVKGLTRHGRLLEIGREIGVFPLSFEEVKKRRGTAPKTPLEWLEALLLTAEEEKGEAALSEDVRKEREQLLAKIQQDQAVGEAIIAAQPPRPVSQLTVADLVAPNYGGNFRRAFGRGDRQGEVTFLDALPIPGWKYDLDVMTPHYGDYYGDGSNPVPTVAPADWLEPNPITFLTIGQGSQFRFDVLGRDSGLIDKVIGWLKSAMSELGAGGKTSAGYGEMRL